jgi:hypothetical protein
MSTSAAPETPKDESKPSEKTPLPGASGTNTSTVPSPEWRVPDSDPRVWARGRTAEEVLGIAEQLNGVVTTYVQRGSPQPTQPQYQPQYQPQQPQQPQYDQDAYLQRRDVEAFAPKLINDAVAPQFAQMHQSIAQANLAQIQRDNAVEFQKYGPEINSYLAKVPFEQRSVDNLNTIVDIVRGKHVEELGREIAGRLVADMGSELRSTGSPMPPASQAEPKYTLKSDKIPEDWSKRAVEAGLTESAVDEFCRANNMDRKTFFEQFGKSAITEVTRRG